MYLSIFHVWRKSVFPSWLFLLGRLKDGVTTVESRLVFGPGLLIKPVVGQCRPLLHGMFFKQA